MSKNNRFISFFLTFIITLTLTLNSYCSTVSAQEDLYKKYRDYTLAKIAIMLGVGYKLQQGAMEDFYLAVEDVLTNTQLSTYVSSKIQDAVDAGSTVIEFTKEQYSMLKDRLLNDYPNGAIEYVYSNPSGSFDFTNYKQYDTIPISSIPSSFSNPYISKTNSNYFAIDINYFPNMFVGHRPEMYLEYSLNLTDGGFRWDASEPYNIKLLDFNVVSKHYSDWRGFSSNLINYFKEHGWTYIYECTAYVSYNRKLSDGTVISGKTYIGGMRFPATNLEISIDQTLSYPIDKDLEYVNTKTGTPAIAIPNGADVTALDGVTAEQIATEDIALNPGIPVDTEVGLLRGIFDWLLDILKKILDGILSIPGSILNGLEALLTKLFVPTVSLTDVISVPRENAFLQTIELFLAPFRLIRKPWEPIILKWKELEFILDFPSIPLWGTFYPIYMLTSNLWIFYMTFTWVRRRLTPQDVN